MGKLSENLGTTQQGYKLDGSNSVDAFPVYIFDSGNPTNPSLAAFTIQGLTYRTELWAIGDEKTVKVELNHFYKNGEDAYAMVKILTN